MRGGMTEYLKLKKSNCKNCYKCIRHCPVKSIQFSGNQAHIISEECILCGNCFVICPQNAKEIASDVDRCKVLLSENKDVYATVAPSFAGCYDGVGIAGLEDGLRKLGFAGAMETAIGATYVKTQYEKLVSKGDRDVLISTCCPTVNLLVQKHFPEALKYLAPVVSPMEAAALDIKKRHPGAKVVFIGPCLSKKDEADRYPGYVDMALTFEELGEWMDAAGIKFDKTMDSDEESKARLFPTCGGILKTMAQEKSCTYLAVDGIENCIACLKDVLSERLSHCFIEMSSCVGSCIGGPVIAKHHSYPVKSYQNIIRYAGEQDFGASLLNDDELTLVREAIALKSKQMPNDSEIEDIFRRMGKNKPEDQLNCGSCGYETCRDKAIAVYQGKADMTMCLPFLKEKAESLTSNIIGNTPNGIIVVNEQFEVQLINNSARKIMNIHNAGDVMGEQVIRILDPKPFMDVYTTGRDIKNRKVYLAEYDRYVEMSVIYDKNFHILMCLMRDVTAEENAKAEREKISAETVDVADKVVDRQMRIVQEIASLLGETAAETKIALTKLKESIKNE